MFENALIESRRDRRSTRRLLTLPAAVVAHVLVLVTVVTIQLWAVEEVGEPEQAIQVVLPPQAPPPPPPPPPLGQQTRAAPVTPEAVVQPWEVPPDVPSPSPGSGTGVEGSLTTDGDGETGGDPNGTPGGVPGPTPTPGPEVKAPERLTSVMEAPERIGGLDPIYPEAARRAHIEGVVILEAVIERDGTVGAVHVLVDRVRFGAEEAALSAVRLWRYRPARVDGRPLAVIMTITVTFRLD